jgi:hypothetical protein
VKRLYSLFLETFITVVGADALHGDVDNDLLNSLRVKSAQELGQMAELTRLAYMESSCVRGTACGLRTHLIAASHAVGTASLGCGGGGGEERKTHVADRIVY